MARPDDVTDDPRAIRVLRRHGAPGEETEQLSDAFGHPFVPNTELAPGDWAVHWMDDSGEVTGVTEAMPSSFGTPLLRQHLRTADGRAVSRPVAHSGSTTICTHNPHCDPYDHGEIARLTGQPTSGASPFLPSMSPRARRAET
ncbi:hypothetical protein Franean1_5048 [Parafrankia sp. EAN1pec]|uniref:hypothetical protein n=1 Tax=Parafrankia sp. (strain EAN1pec) TaxID=298653 RepID=UPI0000543B37|nr:hypothetical protein Franean1_5048 [Frankia sp. EAN1pec]